MSQPPREPPPVPVPAGEQHSQRVRAPRTRRATATLPVAEPTPPTPKPPSRWYIEPPRATRQLADASLCLAGIISVTILSAIHKDWPMGAVLTPISLFAVRGTELILHATQIRRRRDD